MYVERACYQGLNHRTLAAIQKQITGHDKRNSVSSSFHAKSDKDQIAAWRRDLDSILHIFTVRPASPIWQELTPSFLEGGVVNQ